MTREKIIQGLQFTIEMCLFDPMTGAKRPKEVLNDLDKTTVDACEGAIKLLEQESILDKIRAEIVKKHLSVIEKNDFESGRTYGYEEVLEIIDKYKTESEAEDG